MNRSTVKVLLLLLLLFPGISFATTVNVAVPSYSMSLVAFMAAKERGYYQQEGLDVNFVLMPAAIASRALIAGNVDFATVGGSALTAALGGAPLRLLFSSYNRALFWLYSKPDIADVKDLKGKKIGVSSIGSGPDSMLRDLLRVHGLQAGKTIVVIHSTISPKTLKRIVEMAAAQNVIIVDAPISGGETGAYQRNLCYMVGGSAESVARCREVFTTSGAEIVHLGDVGAGTAAKFINQVLVCINLLAMFEGVSLAERAGLDQNMLQRVLHSSAGQSYMADHWFERVERVSRSPEALRHQWEGLHKTLAVALEYAQDLGVSLPGTALAQQNLAKIVGCDKGK
jgi:3-hydroxyisobutyrate dehydrogenase-like beta-hydroxyacid dehydrogenase